MMKTKSKLLMCLLTSSCLISCTSMNKNATLNESLLSKQKNIATTNADLIKADRADQYYEIGRLYQKNGNYSYATTAYQKSLQLDPNYTKSITGLATVYADQKLYIISIPLFEQVTKLEPNAINYNNLGYAYYLNNQYKEANEVLTQAIMLEPDYLQAQKNLALVVSNQPAKVNTELTVSAADSLKNAEPGNAVINKEIEGDKMQLPTIGLQETKQDITSNLIEANSELKIVQSGSGVYELKLERVATSAININSTSPPKLQDTTKDILVAVSGGITFKHMPAISKLFDLATNQVASFNMSDINKFVEIVNGNGIKGMARAVASKFQENSTVQTKVANAKRFNQLKTHIQYKTGYRDDAVRLNHRLLNKPYLIRNDRLPSDVALRLVLGRDLIQEFNNPVKVVEQSNYVPAS